MSITVKKHDDTTNVTYDQVAQPAGDKSPARYSQTAAHSKAAFRPSVTIGSRFNGNRDARRVEMQLTFPSVETIDGHDEVETSCFGGVFFVRPLGAPDSLVQEAAAQLANLAKSPEFQAMLLAGYAD